jgi:hypothetical protein
MGKLIEIRRKFLQMGIGDLPPAVMRATLDVPRPNSERGMRTTPENALKYLYRRLWIDTDLRETILDIRDMDRRDPRVKKVHKRTAAMIVKGGLTLRRESNRRVLREWEQFVRRLKLYRREKLESDARGAMMEGNLPIQWVLDQGNQVVAGIRMPAETMLPLVGANGQFADPKHAYDQVDLSTGAAIARFALWQLSLGRLTPDNYDDKGSLGRPYMDASRTVWRKLTMTEEDLVIRRHTRAAQKLTHVLEGATPDELEQYRHRVENEREDVNTDYYLNKKGGVQTVQGDANLDQIADVVHLLDTFFSGAPAPKGLFGYSGDLARDVLEDMKKDFYEEVDSLQDMISGVYQDGFRLQLLLKGMNPDNFDFEVQFAERAVETKNQAADRALKIQGLGASRRTVWEAAGLDPNVELNRREEETKSTDPYPEPDRIRPGNGAAGAPRVSVTPGNQRKGESATDITTRTVQ